MSRGTASVVVKGPRSQVYALFADREHYRELVAPIGGTLLRTGRSQRQGVGAIHRIGIGPAGLREEITTLEPGRRITYRAVTPLPVRHWIGDVEFHDHPKGTRVDYSLDVSGYLPVPAAVLALTARAMVLGLARGAGKRLRG